MQSNELITINASGKILGRVASEAATKLQGKHRVDFQPHLVPNVIVTIRGIGEVVVTGSKRLTKRYYRHSGYPGSLTSKTLGERLDENPQHVFIDAVRRMLPKNRLQTRYLKHLKFEKESHE